MRIAVLVTLAAMALGCPQLTEAERMTKTMQRGYQVPTEDGTRCEYHYNSFGAGMSCDWADETGSRARFQRDSG